jgi:hypothetical protein
MLEGLESGGSSPSTATAPARYAWLTFASCGIPLLIIHGVP